MCTAPNTIAWKGELTDEGRFKFDFLGKVPYEKLKDAKFPFIQVPCGQCLDCRIQQARTWADRVVLEAKNYQFNYFVTLTYDDSQFPFNGSLDKSHLQLFMRKIRKQFKDVKIRFFGCGEYGDLSRRPHFHVILFNCPLDDLSYNFKMPLWQLNPDGSGYYLKRMINHLMPNNKHGVMYSDRIMKAWDYKGIISVGKVTYDSAAYVSQYVTKKYKPGMKEFYEELGITPEYCAMSTHPGIAAQYYHDNDDFLLYMDKIIIPSAGEAHESIPCRYFDKLFIKKYGEQIFHHGIRLKRLDHRFKKSENIKRLGFNPDFQNHVKDYKLKKRQKLRSQI